MEKCIERRNADLMFFCIEKLSMSDLVAAMKQSSPDW